MSAVSARRRSDRRSQFLIELAAVGQAGQEVLMSELARKMFGLDPPRHFSPLRDKQPQGQREKADAKKRHQRQRFVEFYDTFLRRRAGRIWKNVEFIDYRACNGHDSQKEQPVDEHCATALHRKY